MNLTDRVNQLSERIAPGIWKDKKGQVHFSIPELLVLYGLEETPENRQKAVKMVTELMKKFRPNAPVLYRSSPTDDGEDLR